MALDRLTQITNSGITSGITITGVNLTGVITATSANVGSGITLSGTQINVGSATTIHSSGFQIGSSSLHSTGISLDNINASGVVTATTFSGNLTGNVTGNATGLSGTPNITVGTIGATSLNASGIVTASSGFSGNLTGNVTGNATGLSGTPSITVATINASNATFSGNVSVAGTVTYEDVTNVDSVGIITARSGIRVNDGGVVLIGSGTSTGTASQPLQVTGGAYVSGNFGIGINSPDTTTHIQRSAAQNDTHGILKVESTNSTSGSATNSSLIIKNKYGWSQFMQWENFGLRIGSRNITGGSTGGVHFTYGADNEGIILDSSGRVRMPSQPGFFAAGTTGAANQPSTGDSDMLGTLFNTISQAGGFNTGNHYNTSTGIFTAPVAGKYYTFFNMRWETGNFVQNSYIRIHISKNNNNNLFIHQINGSNEAWGNYMAMSCSGIIDLAAGDTLRPKGGLNGGTAVGWWNESSWGAWLLG